MKSAEVLHFHVTIFPLVVLIMLALVDALRLYKNEGREWTTTNKVLSLASVSVILSSLYSVKLLHLGIFKKDSAKVKAFMKYHYIILVISSVLYLYKEHLYQLTEQPPHHFKPYGILPRFCWYIININCVLCAPLSLKVEVAFTDENAGEDLITGSDAYVKWHGLNLQKLLYFQMILILLYAPLEIVRFYGLLNSGSNASTYRNHRGYVVSNVLYIFFLCSLNITNPFYCYGIKRKKYSIVKSYFIHKVIVMIFGGGFYVQVCEFEEDISLKYQGLYQKFAIIFYAVWSAFEMSQIMQMLIYISKSEDLNDLQRNRSMKLMESNSDCVLNDIDDNSSEVRVPFLKISKLYRIFPSQLKTEMITKNLLGEGQYARVWKGVLTCKYPKQNVPVAIKVLNEKPDRNFEKSLVEEIKVLIRSGDHPHLVKFYGVCTSHRWQLAIVLELCENGNLNQWFKKQDLKNLRCDTLMYFLYKWSIEVAVGMEYLSSKKVIHGDLALRNILLDGQMTAKISDFGMSLRLYSYQHYAVSSMPIFPWKWMAPESLNDLKFSTESDIWSFGVLLWEMFSLGQNPWSGVGWSSNFAYSLIGGLRLSKPELASDEIYEKTMIRCWQIEKVDRLSFKEIAIILRTSMW